MTIIAYCELMITLGATIYCAKAVRDFFKDAVAAKGIGLIH